MSQQTFPTIAAADRRGSQRVPSTATVQFSIWNGHAWTQRSGRVSDLSRIGLRVVFEQPIPNDTKLSIKVDHAPVPVSVKGRSVWCEFSAPSVYIVGVELQERLQTREYVTLCDAAEFDDGIRIA